MVLSLTGYMGAADRAQPEVSPSQACHLKFGDLRYIVHPRAFLAALAPCVISCGSSPRIRQVPPCMQSSMRLQPTSLWITALYAALPHGQQRTSQPLCLRWQGFDAAEAPEHCSLPQEPQQAMISQQGPKPYAP